MAIIKLKKNMTCIVGVIDFVKQTVIIGGDSSSSNDENIFDRNFKSTK